LILFYVCIFKSLKIFSIFYFFFTLFLHLDKLIENFKKLNEILSESIEYIYSNDENEIFKKKLNIIKNQIDIFHAYINSNSNFNQIKFENHPEIFFSSKELKNVQINKFLSEGKFGKVIFISKFNSTKFNLFDI